MYPNDEEKIAFITKDVNICYKVMSIGLKNAGATYNRLMNKVFLDQIVLEDREVSLSLGYHSLEAHTLFPDSSNHYANRSTDQVLLDFYVELSSRTQVFDSNPWTLSVDGASNIKGSGAGIILEGPDGLLIEQSLRFNFRTSNNQAEYEALIVGLGLAKEVGATKLIARNDSQLVINHVKGEFQAKDHQLSKYLNKVKALSEAIESFNIEYVPREQNLRVDLLLKLDSTKALGTNQSVI
ncbi:uncharacterized protein LOC127787482 [Diospyros lotus]|uniref:uncharacterized protein LOC127787482 n=1 Tax=Diospyros lotus TaxID=55363 RepID=UPI002255C139|nr:uncharacterized protein LOC127787482 [Diospyros lotus]